MSSATAGNTISSNTTSSASKPEIVKIGGKTTFISQPTLIQSQRPSTSAPKIVQAQLQPITAQQLVNAKVLGVQGFPQGISQATPLQQRVKTGTTSIRMVNTSNLNIANIDGKPIIIAKSPSMVQSTNQATSGAKTIWTQQANSGTVAKVIGTLPAAQPSQVVFGNQIVKIQPQPLNSATATAVSLQSNTMKNSIATTSSVSGTSIVSPAPTKTAVLLSSTGQTIKVGHAPNVITTANAAGLKPIAKVEILLSNLHIILT